MALYGAYSPKKIYYPTTIKEIVEYAQVKAKADSEMTFSMHT